MKHFINGFVDLGKEELMNRVESQLLKQLIEQRDSAQLISIEQDGTRYWLRFTEEALKTMDFSFNTDLNAFVQELLESDFSAYPRCMHCGQIAFNYSIRSYRSNCGCVSSYPECLDCRCLNDHGLEKIKEVHALFGTSATVKFFLDRYAKPETAEMVVALNLSDVRAGAKADYRLAQWIYEKKNYALTLFSQPDSETVVYQVDSSVLDELLERQLMNDSLNTYIEDFVSDGLRHAPRCETCGCVIYNHSGLHYRQNEQGFLIPHTECAVCQGLEPTQTQMVKEMVQYGQSSLKEAVETSTKRLHQLKNMVVLKKWTPIYAEWGANAVVVGNDLNLTDGSTFDATMTDLNYHIIYETDVELAKQRIEHPTKPESHYIETIRFDEIMLNEHYEQDLAHYREAMAEREALQKEVSVQLSNDSDDLPF